MIWFWTRDASVYYTLFTSETFSLLGQYCGGRLTGPDKGGGLFHPSPEKSKEYGCRYYMSSPLGALMQWKR